MKKRITLLALSALLLTVGACKSDMERDAKLLAQRTCDCFSLLDINDPSADTRSFDSCYSVLESVMEEYDKKYSGEKESQEFGRLFLDEMKNSDMPEGFKELYEFMYEVGVKED